MGAHSSAGPIGLRIGIQLYTVNVAMMEDTPGTLRRLADIGYTEVESAGFGTLATAKEFRSAMDAVGITCPSGHLQFNLQDLDKTFDEAEELGCTFVTASLPRMLLWPYIEGLYALPMEELIPLIQKALSVMTMDEFKRTAEVMNVVGEAASRRRLRFAAHNHTMEMAAVDGATGLDYLIQHTDPAHVSFQLDCGWATMMGHDPAAFVERHPGRITSLHVKDFLPHELADEPTFFTVKGAELGEGIMNYPELFARLKGKGIEHLFVEQDAPFDRMPPLEAAAWDFRYLRELR
jgi:sugar phosphate isomerase/epimerase